MEGGPASLTLLAREHGHSRSTSLDLNKMMQAAAVSVYSDVPSAEPPKPPPVSSYNTACSQLLHVISVYCTIYLCTVLYRCVLYYIDVCVLCYMSLVLCVCIYNVLIVDYT